MILPLRFVLFGPNLGHRLRQFQNFFPDWSLGQLAPYQIFFFAHVFLQGQAEKTKSNLITNIFAFPARENIVSRRKTKNMEIVQLEPYEKNPNHGIFALQGWKPSMVNALRRETRALEHLAIDPRTLCFAHNTSSLRDYDLAKRLELIPICCSLEDLKQLVFPHECDCDAGWVESTPNEKEKDQPKACTKCRIPFEINVVNNNKGSVKPLPIQKNQEKSKDILAVWGRDIQVVGGSKIKIHVNPNLLICFLGAHQSLQLRGAIIKGSAALKDVGAKFGAYQVKPSFRQRIEVHADPQINQVLSTLEKQALCKCCMRGMFEYDSKKDEIVLPLTREMKDRCFVGCRECFSILEKFPQLCSKKLLRFSPTTEYLFSFESMGTYTPAQALSQTCLLIAQRMRKLILELDTL
jgi:hypothetical protein